MQFEPNFDLLHDCNVSSKEFVDITGALPCIAVFRRDNKTLVYICDNHRVNIAFDMVERCFADDFEIKPDVLVAEIENAEYERKLTQHGFQDNNLAHAVGVAAKRNIPVVFADLSLSQMVDVVNAGFPNNQVTKSDLSRILHAQPDSDGDINQQMHAYLCLYGRDRFMLQNIATALNKYDTVFVIFGWSHFANQRLALEDMMGKPEYITKIKNMRGDFSDVKIEPIKLCEFEMVKDDDKRS